MSSRMRNAFQHRLLWAIVLPLCVNGWTEAKSEYLYKKMKEAYASVRTYQADMEVKSFHDDGSVGEKKAVYTFRKPNHIRIDFETPHKGWVLVYPDKDGKVAVKPSGWLRIFSMDLNPEDPLLQVSPGQSITETDLGLLIENIFKSLTVQRKGEVSSSCADDRIVLRVLSRDEFQEGVQTFYTFAIDRGLWLPVEVKESTARGRLKKVLVFKNLKLNVTLPEGFFGTD